MKVIRSGPLLFLVTLALGCASTGDSVPSGELVGCYYFEQDAAAREMRLPWGFRLMDEPLAGWPRMAEQDAWAAETLVDEDTTRDSPFAHWQVLPGDSIRVGHPGGGGWSLTLAPTETGLAGTARPVGDAGLGPRPLRDVTLLRARCPE